MMLWVFMGETGLGIAVIAQFYRSRAQVATDQRKAAGGARFINAATLKASPAPTPLLYYPPPKSRPLHLALPTHPLIMPP
ncbi:hypothetical protein BR1R5_39030 [Pseudomonas sp. BR1R-5]|nr:hypothetical protein BR1R5_39030 [Pseudomonas sp. BR1R-5]